MRSKINEAAKQELRNRLHETDATNPTRVSVGLGYKLNMGNYESLDLHFSVSDDARKGESAGEAFDRVYAFVEKRLFAKIEEARG